MSKHHVEKITCPHCHKESDFILWDSINTSLDPEMKAKVRSGEAFKWVCTSCGYEANVEYATLYHQMEDLVMIYYVPGEGDKTETIELMKGKYKNTDGEFVEMDMKIDEGYYKRVVDTRNQFREKLVLLDEALDDRIIELMKLFMIAQIKDNDDDLEIEEMLFDKLEDGTRCFAIHLKDGRWAHTDFSQNFYKHMEQKFGKILEEEKDEVVINLEWALSLMERQE